MLNKKKSKINCDSWFMHENMVPLLLLDIQWILFNVDEWKGKIYNEKEIDFPENRFLHAAEL